MLITIKAVGVINKLFAIVSVNKELWGEWMNPDLFKNSSAGRCRRQREGYYAFLPNSLPPKLEIDWKFAQLLSQADAALGELSGVGRLLPNPHLLIQPYLRIADLWPANS